MQPWKTWAKVTADRAPARISRWLVTVFAFALSADGWSQPDRSTSDVLRIDLPMALRLADERNLDVAILFERLAEASAELAQARTLAIPSISVGGSYNRHTGNLQETSGQIADVERVSRFGGLGAGAIGAGDPRVPGLAVEVDVADAVFQPLVARQNRAAIEAAATANRHQVLLEVATAYLELVEAKSERQIVTELLERAEDLAKLTADYAEAGEGLLADAELAAVQPLLFEQRRAAAEERAEAAAALLARLLHFDISVVLEPVDETIPVLEIFSASESLEQLVARALDDRPETDQLEALVGAAEADLTAERYGFFIPSVALTYSAGEFGGAPGSSVRDTGDRDDLTFLLYWRFDSFGLGNRARLDAKRAQLRRVALERDQLRDAITAEVREGYARVQRTRQQMQFAALAVTRARQAYTLHRDRIFDQQGLPLEAMQAMQTLATAELTYLDTRVGHTLAQIRLHTALGNPLDTQL